MNSEKVAEPRSSVKKWDFLMVMGGVLVFVVYVEVFIKIFL